MQSFGDITTLIFFKFNIFGILKIGDKQYFFYSFILNLLFYFADFSVQFHMAASFLEKPQIIVHVQKSLNYTIYDTRWVPNSAKFVVLGNYARGTGALQIYEINKGDVTLVKEVWFI